MLADWADNDVSTIARLFRQSRLYRQKWDRAARAGETYGQGTINRVLVWKEAVEGPTIFSYRFPRSASSNSCEMVGNEHFHQGRG